ncbi:SGNH hydrolase-type esterase domain [Phaffia rhodozyma]|uniref:SGNH hydrolase-type esterase domain n=1 Tax=Phaffia rhodozyma TaxID=264483 RepID=A0A0F7SSG4_PHARH|nr:SGNH hydrolase-type esterase domain [Phaffia rhodozyma]
MNTRYASRSQLMVYVPWAILSVVLVHTLLRFSADPIYTHPADASPVVKSIVSSFASFPKAHSLSLPSRRIPTLSRKKQQALTTIPSIPPWVDQILVPETGKTGEIASNGECMIGSFGWEECGINDRFCAAYGEDAIARSRIYTGQTKRLRRVMRKAARGEPITMGILGGSVTCGQTLNEKHHRNYKYQLAEWWEYAFPDSNLTFIDGSVAAQGSAFFSVCFGAYIPHDVDIIFVESAINDQYMEKDAKGMESLMRGLMILPQQPAIIFLQTFGLMFDKIATGGSLHIDVAAYYDHPVLSSRQIILPKILDDPESVGDYFGPFGDGTVDLRHYGYGGHMVMADITIQFLSSVFCKVQHDRFLHGIEPETPLVQPPADIPRLRLMEPYDPKHIVPIYAPTCNSTTSKFRPITPSSPTAWSTVVINRKTFLAGNNPGDEVRFKINLLAAATIQINHLRSSTYNLGTATCYLEAYGPESAVTLDGYWSQKISVGDLATIKENAEVGEHEIICRVGEVTNSPSGGHKFLIVSIQSF